MVDVTKLTDDELADLPGAMMREQSVRKNKIGFPIAKKKADDGLSASFPKTKLAVKTSEDVIDGKYMVVDVGNNDNLMKVLLSEGGIFKSAGKVRIPASLAVKGGGIFEKLEALL